MKYLLDTNILSDARRSASPSLDAWLAAQSEQDLAISVITLFELEVGIRRKERADATQGARLRLWLEDAVMPLFEERTLPIDRRVARTAAGLHVPDPMPDMDALIAATAISHGLTLVTRNVRDMEHTGVALLNPWELSAPSDS